MEVVIGLVVRARDGDPEAFAQVYETYAPTIFRFLRRRLEGSNEVVEDLTEDVFVKVYEKLGQYEERGLPFTAWLYRIAHNHLVDYLRARTRAAAYPLGEACEIAGPAAGAAFSRVLDRATLAPALAQLTSEQRRAVELRFLHGLSLADTATLMDRSDEAVKKLQARALTNLRRLLSPSAANGRRARQAAPAAA